MRTPEKKMNRQEALVKMPDERPWSPAAERALADLRKVSLRYGTATREVSTPGWRSHIPSRDYTEERPTVGLYIGEDLIGETGPGNDDVPPRYGWDEHPVRDRVMQAMFWALKRWANLSRLGEGWSDEEWHDYGCRVFLHFGIREIPTVEDGYRRRVAVHKVLELAKAERPDLAFDPQHAGGYNRRKIVYEPALEGFPMHRYPSVCDALMGYSLNPLRPSQSSWDAGEAWVQEIAAWVGRPQWMDRSAYGGVSHEAWGRQAPLAAVEARKLPRQAK
ncbi:MAG: hypothetical protein EBU84_05625 [Actinobacteria bacterium]|nr:hypothetical protein [Actinomycetota bacterium]